MKLPTICSVTILLVGCLGFSAGAQQTAVDGEPKLATDLKINKLVAEEIEPILPILQDKQINKHVQKFGALVASAVPRRPYFHDFTYNFKVLDSPEVAIYAVPGGTVYISRGLLRRLNSEGELVGIIAHAIAHIASRDYVRRLPNSNALKWQDIKNGILCSFVPSGLGCVDPKKHKFRYENYMLTFTHLEERYTDLWATDIIARSGYDPDDLGVLLAAIDFDKIKAGNCLNDRYLYQRAMSVYEDAKDLRQRQVYDPKKVPYMSQEFMDFRKLVQSLP